MNNQMLSELFDSLPDSASLIEPATSSIVYCNRKGYQALGLQADEVLNHFVLTLQKDVSGMPAYEEIAEQISQIEVFTYIGRHLRKNGSDSSLEVKTIPFHYDGNEYYLSVARNTTNRVSIVKRLKKTRKNYGLHSTKPATVYGTGA